MKLIFIFFTLAAFAAVLGQKLPNYLKCIESSCTEAISYGRVTEETISLFGQLKVAKKGKVRIVGKNVEPEDSFWLIEQDGYYGFIDVSKVRENTNDVKSSTEIVLNPFLKKNLNDATEKNEPKLFSSENLVKNDETESTQDQVKAEPTNENLENINKSVDKKQNNIKNEENIKTENDKTNIRQDDVNIKVHDVKDQGKKSEIESSFKIDESLISQKVVKNENKNEAVKDKSNNVNEKKTKTDIEPIVNVKDNVKPDESNEKFNKINETLVNQDNKSFLNLSSNKNDEITNKQNEKQINKEVLDRNNNPTENINEKSDNINENLVKPNIDEVKFQNDIKTDNLEEKPNNQNEKLPKFDKQSIVDDGLVIKDENPINIEDKSHNLSEISKVNEKSNVIDIKEEKPKIDDINKFSNENKKSDLINEFKKEQSKIPETDTSKETKLGNNENQLVNKENITTDNDLNTDKNIKNETSLKSENEKELNKLKNDNKTENITKSNSIIKESTGNEEVIKATKKDDFKNLYKNSLSDPWLHSTCSVDDSKQQFRSPILRLIGYLDILSQRLIRFLLELLNLKSTKFSNFVETWFQLPFENFVTIIFTLLLMLFISIIPKLFGFRRNWYIEYNKQLNITKELEWKLTTIEEVRNKLTIQNHNFENVIENYKDKLTKMKEESVKYRENIEQITKNFENRLTKKSDEYKDLMEQFIQLETGIKERDEKIININKEHQEQNKKVQNEKKQLNENINKFQKEINKSNQMNMELKKKMDNMTEEISTLNGTIDNLKEQIDSKNEEYDILKESFKNLQKFEELNEDEYQDKIDQSLENTELKKKIEELNGKIEKLTQSLDINNIELSKLKELNDEYQKKKLDAESEMKRAIDEMKDAQTKLKVMEEYFHSREVEIQKSLGHQEIEKTSSNEQVQKLRQDIDELTSNIKKRDDQIERMKKEITDSNNSAQKFKLQSNEYFIEFQRLERDLRAAQDQNSQLRNRLSNYTGPIPPPSMFSPVPPNGPNPNIGSPFYPHHPPRTHSRHSGESYSANNSVTMSTEDGGPVIVGTGGPAPPPPGVLLHHRQQNRNMLGQPQQSATTISQPFPIYNLKNLNSVMPPISSQNTPPSSLQQQQYQQHNNSGRNSVNSYSRKSNKS